jgi:hypothetical protein
VRIVVDWRTRNRRVTGGQVRLLRGPGDLGWEQRRDGASGSMN